MPRNTSQKFVKKIATQFVQGGRHGYRVNTEDLDKSQTCLKYNGKISYTFICFFSQRSENINKNQIQVLKELGHQIDSTFGDNNVPIDLGLNKGRGRFLNFPDDPPLLERFQIFLGFTAELGWLDVSGLFLLTIINHKKSIINQ
jgi:hypothetical protein